MNFFKFWKVVESHLRGENIWVAREYPLCPLCNSFTAGNLPQFFIAGNLHRFEAIQLSFFLQPRPHHHMVPLFSSVLQRKMELSCQLWISLFFWIDQLQLHFWIGAINFPFPLNHWGNVCISFLIGNGKRDLIQAPPPHTFPFSPVCCRDKLNYLVSCEFPFFVNWPKRENTLFKLAATALLAGSN